MKTITIRTKDGPIVLNDNSDQDKDEVLKDLSALMQATTIAIVHTTEASAVIRPSSISGFVVEDDSEQPTQETTQEEQTKITNKQSEQTIETSNKDEDIVTDME